MPKFLSFFKQHKALWGFMLLSCLLSITMVFTIFKPYQVLLAQNASNESRSESERSKLVQFVVLSEQLKTLSLNQSTTDEIQHYQTHIEKLLATGVFSKNTSTELKAVHSKILAEQQKLLGLEAKQTSQLQLLAESTETFKTVINKGLVRLAEFKKLESFEQVTANANRTELFNALNQMRADEQFSQLKSDGESLIRSYEDMSITVYRDKAELEQSLQYLTQYSQFYLEQVRAFSDTPTRMGLMKWHKDLHQEQQWLMKHYDLLKQKQALTSDLNSLVINSNQVVEQQLLTLTQRSENSQELEAKIYGSQMPSSYTFIAILIFILNLILSCLLYTLWYRKTPSNL